jgi:hypothetical protein
VNSAASKSALSNEEGPRGCLKMATGVHAPDRADDTHIEQCSAKTDPA